MREIIIDCVGIETRRELHRALAQALAFPDWYGNNLDALHDMLTSVTEDTELTLSRFSELGSFAKGFVRVFEDAQRENPRLKIQPL